MTLATDNVLVWLLLLLMRETLHYMLFATDYSPVDVFVCVINWHILSMKKSSPPPPSLPSYFECFIDQTGSIQIIHTHTRLYRIETELCRSSCSCSSSCRQSVSNYPAPATIRGNTQMKNKNNTHTTQTHEITLDKMVWYSCISSPLIQIEILTLCLPPRSNIVSFFVHRRIKIKSNRIAILYRIRHLDEIVNWIYLHRKNHNSIDIVIDVRPNSTRNANGSIWIISITSYQICYPIHSIN